MQKTYNLLDVPIIHITIKLFSFKRLENIKIECNGKKNYKWAEFKGISRWHYSSEDSSDFRVCIWGIV